MSSRREEIISAAIDLFYEDGYHKASTRDISRRIGITPAALYYHFNTKEELLYTIIEKASNDLYFLLKSCFTENRDPIEQLRHAMMQHILAIKQERKGAKIIIEDKRFLSGELKRQIKDKEKAIFSIYKDHLKELQETGRIRNCDLTVTTFAILGMINWLYHWYRPNKGLSFEQVGAELINTLLHGILSE